MKELLDPVAEGISPFWPLTLQIVVIGIGLYSLYHDVPQRMSLSGDAANELWKSAIALVPPDLRLPVTKFREFRIRPLWQTLPRHRHPWQKPPLQRIRHAPVSNEKDPKVRTESILDHYGVLLDSATTRVEVAEIALCLLSDLFSSGKSPGPTERERQTPAREVRRMLAHFFDWVPNPWRHQRPDKNEQERAVDQAYAVEVQPFVKYFRRDLTSPVDDSYDVPPPEGSRVRNWIQKSVRFLDRRFPDYKFILVGIVSILMLTAICLQPVPFLVGPSTLSFGWRVVSWLVNAGALIVTFSLFHRTCYEQHRFRKLVEGLAALIPMQELGLSNRQLALVLSKASEPVANITTVPCAMVFLIYASHLHSLGGVPMAGELSILLGLSLLAMIYSYTRLQGAALATRAAVVEAYTQEQADAARLLTRLQSYVDGQQPLQDDESSLLNGLRCLIRGTSTTPTDRFDVVKGRIKERVFRDHLCEYLRSVIHRDQTFVKQLGEIRTGVLAPLLTNPVTAALMIPIGGASGLTAIEWIVSNAR